MEQTPASRFIDVLGRLGYKTQQQIADLLQIARPTAGTIVRQEREPSFSDVSRLKAEHDEVNIDYIFTGRGDALHRNLKPAAQLPPPVPSKLEPLQAPAGPGKQTDEELRRQMAVVAESAELREVKSERDHLRKQNESLLAIISRFSGASDTPAAGGLGKAEASAEAASVRDTVDEIAEEYPVAYRIVSVKRIGFEPSHLRIA